MLPSPESLIFARYARLKSITVDHALKIDYRIKGPSVIIIALSLTGFDVAETTAKRCSKYTISQANSSDALLDGELRS